MPSTRAIRGRIRSVKNIAQITKALQMVASSKMRRAQERVEQSRPYAEQLRELVSRLARVTGEDIGNLALLKQRPIGNIGYVLITPDRGMSGALPSNINRKAAASALEQQKTLAEQGIQPGIEYIAVGRKGRDFIMRNQFHLAAEFTNYGDRPSLLDASAIAQVATEAFLKEEVDVVYLIYAKFINTVRSSQRLCNCCRFSRPPMKADRAAKALSTSTNLTRRASSKRCCPATSTFRSTRRCSKCWPAFIRHKW